ncbi:MAG: hypothetical protein ACRDRA_12410 [Pseudonocardiaceae bacterium]
MPVSVSGLLDEVVANADRVDATGLECDPRVRGGVRTQLNFLITGVCVRCLVWDCAL